MKKRIVILTQYFPPEMGAPQSRLYETALGLQKRGWTVQIITAMPNYPTGKISDAYKGKFSSQETMDGMAVTRYWLYASNAKKAIPRIISMLSFSFVVFAACFRLRKFRPDFILTESPPLTLALSGLWLSKWTGAKHIMNVSDIWPLSAYELGAIGKGFLYSRLEDLEKYLYRKSFACTGQSDEIVEQLKKSGAVRAHLYRNGVDIARFNATPSQSPSAKARIVYAGLLGVAQGIYELCRQIDFASLNAELHIYGDGAERSEIEKFVAENGNRGIYLHKPVKRNKVPAMLMQYDLTIIPLIKPIFGAIPSKIYEAMAAGLPIIFAGGGEGALLVEKHKTGWICQPSDYTYMQELIRKAAALPSHELAAIKQQCRKTAEEVFNREIQINNLSEFLTKNS